jgi:hypothetical protein
MSALLPEARARSCRCGHSSSTGGMPTKSGPGKVPSPPIFASSTASSPANAAILVVRSGAFSKGTKSTVPAMVVRRPSIGKRVMVWMPD